MTTRALPTINRVVHWKRDGATYHCTPVLVTGIGYDIPPTIYGMLYDDESEPHSIKFPATALWHPVAECPKRRAEVAKP